MLKIFNTIIVMLMVILLPVTICSAEEITNYCDLIENGKILDGKEVTIKGEAIKEPMNRGEYTWINIGDGGGNAMGIWVKSSEMNKINVYGDYKNKGDIVKVTGIFHRACREHGGDMDIHANSISVVEQGKPVLHVLSNRKLIASTALTFMTAALAAIYWKKRSNLFKKLKV